MPRALLAFTVLLLPLGCAGADETTTSPVPVASGAESVDPDDPAEGEANGASPSTEPLVLSDTQLISSYGPLLTLGADGRVTTDEGDAGRVYPDGRYVGPDGTLIAHLRGTELTFGEHTWRIEGSVGDFGDGHLQIDADGSVIVHEPDGSSHEVVQVSPADSPSRPVMLLLMLVLML